MTPAFEDYLTAAIDQGKNDHEALDAALARFPSRTPPRLYGPGWYKLYKQVHALRQARERRAALR